MAKKKRAKTKKEERSKFFKGEYIGVGKEKEVDKSIGKAHNLPHLLMTEAKQTTQKETLRIIRRKGLRVTPKTPRLRR